MKRPVKILKDIKPPRRTVSESEALEFINNVDEWRKKNLLRGNGSWRKLKD